jgi:transcriptional regulator with XRE-family HTH domain/tetratricopeptide (TPR) repeat protein
MSVPDSLVPARATRRAPVSNVSDCLSGRRGHGESLDEGQAMSQKSVSLGALIRTIRERSCLSQEELAHRCGLSVRTIRNLEGGRVARPQPSSVRALLEALSLSTDEQEAVLIAATRGGPEQEIYSNGWVLRPAPCMLPADVVDFVGREPEVDFLKSRSCAETSNDLPVPPVAIIGPGGVGKTALAVHAAHLLRGEFPDGQLFIDMRGENGVPLGSYHALGRLLRALGLDGAQVPTGADERAETYRLLTADRRILTVLDNVTSESQIRPLLPSTGTGRLLITSRVPLLGPGGVETLELPGLESHLAVDLLARVVGRARVEREHQAARELVLRCDLLPLAVRIAGARLLARPRWDLAGLATELSDERRRLDALCAADLSVRASISVSYQDLSPAARAAFRFLSLPSLEDFGAWIAAPLMDITVDDAERTVDELAHAQLVHYQGRDSTGTPRYRFHDLTGVYAREQSSIEDTPSLRRAAIERLTQSWLTLAEQADRDLPITSDVVTTGDTPRRPLPPTLMARLLRGPLGWFDVERANLLSAAEDAAAFDLGDAVWELAGCLTSYFIVRNYPVEWDHLHLAALAYCIQRADARGEAASLTALSCSQWSSGLDTNVTRLRTAIATFRSLDDLPGQAKALRVLSDNLRLVGQRDHSASRLHEAHRAAVQALDLASRLEDPGLEAETLIGLGTTQQHLGQHGQARETLQLALQLNRTLGARQGEAVALWRLAQLASDDSEYDTSHTLLAEALDITQALGDTRGQMRVRLEMAHLNIVEGNLCDGESLLRSVLDAPQQIVYGPLASDTHLLEELLTQRKNGRPAAQMSSGNDFLPHPPTTGR